MTQSKRHLRLPGAHNIRDLGGYRAAGGRMTPWRRFLRADSPHRLAVAEQGLLREEGLATVIDLRTVDELAAGPNPFAAVEGLGFHNLPLFDDLSPVLMAREEARPEDPLLHFYLTALDQRGSAIRDILRTIAGADRGAVMFHCTAGKDRTGIIAALLLGLAEVPAEEIVADYAMTEDLITDLVAEFLELSRQRGGDVVAYARLLRAPAETMQKTLAHIEARYGSVSGYLDTIGLAPGDRSALRDRLLAEGAMV